MREIYRAVSTAIADAGYACAHAFYPSRVLGHKIGRIPLPGLGARVVAGFDLRTYLYFGEQLLATLPRLGRVPLWNDDRLADVPPDRGLWAIEPHVSAPGVGAKWEEILVVTEADAYWLDDALPHVAVRSHAA